MPGQPDRARDPARARSPARTGARARDLYLDPEGFHEAFASDVDSATTAVTAATQRPFAETAFAGPSGPPAWKTGIPCWYLLGTEDNAILPALQGFMAERANATILEVPASHVSDDRRKPRARPARAWSRQEP